MIKYFILSLGVWLALADAGLSITHHSKKNYIEKKHNNAPDVASPDEFPQTYEAIDLQDICKNTKNPKCEAIIDNFCNKACNAPLCSTHGSLRGMCRLMCEREDLIPQCIKKGPSKLTNVYKMLNKPAIPVQK
jgi:hypothetical protein